MEEVVRRIRIDATANTGNAESSLSRLRDTVHSISGGQRSAASAAKSHSKALSSFGIAAKTAAKHSNFLADTLKRVVVYRALRAAIKEVVKMFQEGLTNAYWFSKGINGDLAQALDGLAVKAQTMKNQLGAAFGGLLQTIMPIIQQLISWITALASSITALFAMFGGRGTYLKAVDASAEFAKNTKSGAGSAKKMKDYLMGIDELNVIKQPNDGGGGGGSAIPDYASMFEVAELPEWMQGIQDLLNADMFISAGARLADYFNGLVANWDSDKWGHDLGEKVQNAIEFAWGFLYGKTTTGTGFDFENLGAKLQKFINGVIDEVDPVMLGNLLTSKIRATIEILKGMLQEYDAKKTGEWLGGLVNGAINNIPWADAGSVVSDSIKDIVNTIAFMVEECDWEQVGTDIATFIGTLDMTGITDAFVHLLSASIVGIGDFVVGLLKPEWQKVEDWWSETAYESGKLSFIRLEEGIISIFDGIESWFDEHIVEPIKEAIMKVVNKIFGGDSETESALIEIGKKIPDTIIMGVTQWQPIKNAMGYVKLGLRLVGLIKDDINDSEQAFKDVGAEIPKHIANGTKNRTTNPFKGIGKKFKEWFTKDVETPEVKESLEEVGSDIVGNVETGAKSKWQKFTEWWSEHVSLKSLFKKGSKNDSVGTETVFEEKLFTFEMDKEGMISNATEAGKEANNAFKTAFYGTSDEGLFSGIALEFQQVGTLMGEQAPEFAGNIATAFTDAINAILQSYNDASSAIWDDITFYFDEKLKELILRQTGLFKSQMMDAAGVARQEIGAIRDALEKLDGFTVHVYIKVHTLGSSGIDSVVGNGGADALPPMAHGGIIKAANGLALPNRGQLFIAREAGAELVGDIGSGRTAVMNNNQIVDSVSSGVYSAMIDALSQTQTTDDRPIVVQVDGREIARAVRSGEKSNGYTLSSNPTFA